MRWAGLVLVAAVLTATPAAASSGRTYYYSQQILKLTHPPRSLDYTITASKRTDGDGIGPAWLLNGLTDQGWWYQVGFSYNLGNRADGSGAGGFRVVVNNFAPDGSRIVSQSRYDRIEAKTGDTIRLKLTAARRVRMKVRDVTVGAERAYKFPAHGPWVGAPDRFGDFTGLMTEQHHLTAAGYSTPVRMVYRGRSGRAVMVLNEFRVGVAAGRIYWKGSPVVREGRLRHGAMVDRLNADRFVTTIKPPPTPRKG